MRLWLFATIMSVTWNDRFVSESRPQKNESQFHLLQSWTAWSRSDHRVVMLFQKKLLCLILAQRHRQLTFHCTEVNRSCVSVTELSNLSLIHACSVRGAVRHTGQVNRATFSKAKGLWKTFLRMLHWLFPRDHTNLLLASPIYADWNDWGLHILKERSVFTWSKDFPATSMPLTSRISSLTPSSPVLSARPPRTRRDINTPGTYRRTEAMRHENLSFIGPNLRP